MPDKTFLIKLKPPELALNAVVAEKVEIQGDYLVMFRSDGTLTGCSYWKWWKAGMKCDRAD